MEPYRKYFTAKQQNIGVKVNGNKIDKEADQNFAEVKSRSMSEASPWNDFNDQTKIFWFIVIPHFIQTQKCDIISNTLLGKTCSIVSST